MENSKSQKNLEPWWNRPLWGDRSMLDKIESIIHKEHDKIPQEVIDHHQAVLAEIKLLAPIARALDSDKFTESDFLDFVKVSNLFAKEVGEYKGLRNYVALFRVAVEAKNSFLTIEQIELSYRSSKQQEFYNYVLTLLEKQLSPAKFINLLEEKLAQILPDISTEEGKNAVNITLIH